MHHQPPEKRQPDRPKMEKMGFSPIKARSQGRWKYPSMEENDTKKLNGFVNQVSEMQKSAEKNGVSFACFSLGASIKDNDHATANMLLTTVWNRSRNKQGRDHLMTFGFRCAELEKAGTVLTWHVVMFGTESDLERLGAVMERYAAAGASFARHQSHVTPMDIAKKVFNGEELLDAGLKRFEFQNEPKGIYASSKRKIGLVPVGTTSHGIGTGTGRTAGQGG